MRFKRLMSVSVSLAMALASVPTQAIAEAAAGMPVVREASAGVASSSSSEEGTVLGSLRAQASDAQVSLDQARAAQAATESELAAAQAEVKRVDGELESLRTAAANAQEEKAQAEQAYADAKAAADQAQADVEAKQGEVALAQEAIDEAQARVDGANEVLSRDRSPLEDDEAAAQARVDAAAAEVEAAHVDYDKGSLGFFDEQGFDFQTKVLDAADENVIDYSDSVKVGDEASATALGHMRDALDWIDHYNEMRTSLGLPELKVTDRLMADAQANADYSAEAMRHSGQFNVGENIAWNWGSDPYLQWYDKEKVAFDNAYADITGNPATSAPTGEAAYDWYQSNRNAVSNWLVNHLGKSEANGSRSVGHYINIINPDYGVTGFGVSTVRGTYGYTFGQTFGFRRSGETSYTVSEYRQLFDVYASPIEQRLADAEAEQEAADQALADAQAALVTFDSEMAQAEQDRAAALQDRSAAEDQKAVLEGELATLEATRDGKVAAANAAERAAGDAAARAVEAQAAAEGYGNSNEYTSAHERLSAAEVSLEDAKNAVLAAESALGHAQDKLARALDLSLPEGDENGLVFEGVADLTYMGGALTQGAMRVYKKVCDPDDGRSERWYLVGAPAGELVVGASDASLTYEDNVRVGTATVRVAGVGKFTGAASTTFEVAPANIAGSTVAALASQTYTGSALTPAPVVTQNGATLKSGTDYTLAYKDNVNAGTATVTITGKGNYAGTKTVTFKIAAASIAGATVARMANQTYRGSAFTPTPSLVLDDKTLTSGTDYELSYADNVSAGTATVTFTGKGNYTGTKTANFKIAPASMESADVTIAKQTYAGKELTPAPKVTFRGATLKEGTDYTVDYQDNVAAGTATATLTGAGNFTGTKTVTFEIAPASIASARAAAILSLTYTGKAHEPSVLLSFEGATLSEGTDYTVAYEDNVAAGTGKALVTGAGNFAGERALEFSITPASIAGAAVGSIADELYEGKPVTPEPVVRLDGVVLAKDTDYTLSYADNNKPGKATVTVEGKGNYAGTAKATFTIDRFPDVRRGSWFYLVVNRAAELGLVNGFADGTFGPNERVTRGQVAVMLWNMAGRPAAAGTPKAFPDVKAGAYYYNAVRWARSTGVVSGFGNGTFGPGEDVTREQLATMLANYAKKIGGLTVTGSKVDFSGMKDAGKVSGYAQPAVGWCFKNKVISGKSGNLIDPQGTATRAETAKMVVFVHDMLQ